MYSHRLNSAISLSQFCNSGSPDEQSYCPTFTSHWTSARMADAHGSSVMLDSHCVTQAASSTGGKHIDFRTLLAGLGAQVDGGADSFFALPAAAVRMLMTDGAGRVARSADSSRTHGAAAALSSWQLPPPCVQAQMLLLHTPVQQGSSAQLSPPRAHGDSTVGTSAFPPSKRSWPRVSSFSLLHARRVCVIVTDSDQSCEAMGETQNVYVWHDTYVRLTS